MIKIVANGRTLDMRPDTNATLNYDNSMFLSDIIPGDYTMPFALAYTVNNVEALGNPDEIQNNDAFNKNIPVEIYFHDELRHEGILNILNVDVRSGSINVNVFLGFGWLNQAIRDKKINELDYGNVVLSTQKKSIRATLRSFSYSGLYSLIINHITYSALTIDNVAGAINADTLNAKCTAVVSHPSGTDVITLTANESGCENAFDTSEIVTTGSGGSYYIWDLLINGNGTYNQLWANQYEADIQAVLNNSITKSYPDLDYVFFPVYNTDFYGVARANNTDWKDTVNYYYLGNFQMNLLSNVFNGNYYSICPFIYLAAVLDKIMLEAGIILKSNFLTSAEFRQEAFYNILSLDCVDYNNYLSADINMFKSQFAIKDCLPDLPVNNFLLALKVKYNLVFNYNYKTRELEVEPFNTYYNKREALDRTSITEPLPLVEPVSQDGLKLMMAQDTADIIPGQFDPTYMQDYIVAPGLKTVNSPTGTLYMYKGLDETNDKIRGPGTSLKWLVPQAGQQGISDAFKQPASGFAARSLKFLGMYNNSNGDSYPLASSDVYDYAGTVHATWALIWKSDYGLYAKFWKTYQEFFWARTKKVTYVMQLTPYDLAELDRVLRQYIDGTEFFINKITVSAGPRLLDSARVELYKI